jgi:hypothetical protein
MVVGSCTSALAYIRQRQAAVVVMVTDREALAVPVCAADVSRVTAMV